MRGRVVGAALVVFFVVAVLAGRLAVLAYVAALSAMAAGEIYRLSRARGYSPAPLVGLLGMASLLFAAHMRGERAPVIFPGIVAAVIGLAFIVLMIRRSHEQVTRGLAFTMLPVLSVGLLSSHVLVVRGGRDGTALALLLGAMVAMSELGAIVLDRWLSRRDPTTPLPLWERFAGAVAGSALAGLVVSLVRPETVGALDAIALGIVVGVATSTGESVGMMIEQDLLPGEHGVKRAPAGMFRRIDGALLGAPAFFYALRVLAR